MPKILAYTSPAIGHLFPVTAMLLELRERGHDVHLRTLASQVERMQALGLHARAINREIESIKHTDYQTKNPRKGLENTASVFYRRGQLDAPDLQAAIDEVQPDALIVDLNCWGAMFAAEASGLPWATFSPFIPPMSSPDTPPFGPGLRPMSGPLGKARDAVVQRLVIGAIEKAMMPSINELRSTLELPEVQSVDEFYRKAPLMMVATAKPFEYETTDWGPNVLMIGACSWDPPQSAPDWLETIDRPIVLVTTSSEFQDDGLLVRSALEGLAGEPVQVVATMPAGLDSTLKVPANAIVEQFVPHGPVLDRAVVAVTHGGMGATQKALSRGIPVCVVPFGRDQLEVARRVEVSQSGTRLPAKKLTPDRLREAVLAAMKMTAGAGRVADGLTVAGGPVAGADAIERRLLAGSLRVAA
jgi:MGT family glycosyltransferase